MHAETNGLVIAMLDALGNCLVFGSPLACTDAAGPKDRNLLSRDLSACVAGPKGRNLLSSDRSACVAGPKGRNLLSRARSACAAYIRVGGWAGAAFLRVSGDAILRALSLRDLSPAAYNDVLYWRWLGASAKRRRVWIFFDGVDGKLFWMMVT